MSTSLSKTALTSSPYSEAPKTVSYTVPDTVTDWVLLQFRSISDGSAIASKSCFVSNHGYVIDPEGYSTNISLGSIGISPGSYYIVVKHRNHLAIMSNSTVLINGLTKYDFTTGSDKYYGTINGAKQLETGVWGMIAGDVDGSGDFGPFDLINVRSGIVNGETGYLSKDVDLSGDMGPFDLIRVREGLVNGYATAVP